MPQLDCVSTAAAVEAARSADRERERVGVPAASRDCQRGSVTCPPLVRLAAAASRAGTRRHSAIPNSADGSRSANSLVPAMRVHTHSKR